MTRPNYLRGWKMPKTETQAHSMLAFVDTQSGVRISHPIPGYSDEEAEIEEAERFPTPMFRWFGAALAVVVVAAVLAIVFGGPR